MGRVRINIDIGKYKSSRMASNRDNNLEYGITATKLVTIILIISSRPRFLILFEHGRPSHTATYSLDYLNCISPLLLACNVSALFSLSLSARYCNQESKTNNEIAAIFFIFERERERNILYDWISKEIFNYVFLMWEISNDN